MYRRGGPRFTQKTMGDLEFQVSKHRFSSFRGRMTSVMACVGGRRSDGLRRKGQHAAKEEEA